MASESAGNGARSLFKVMNCPDLRHNFKKPPDAFSGTWCVGNMPTHPENRSDGILAAVSAAYAAAAEEVIFHKIGSGVNLKYRIIVNQVVDGG